MSDIDKSIEKILNNFMMKEEGVISNNPHPYIEAIKQLMVDEFDKLIGEDDLWDKKYPLSIKQDIKSRNHLRYELRQKLEELKK